MVGGNDGEHLLCAVRVRRDVCLRATPSTAALPAFTKNATENGATFGKD